MSLLDENMILTDQSRLKKIFNERRPAKKRHEYITLAILYNRCPTAIMHILQNINKYGYYKDSAFPESFSKF